MHEEGAPAGHGTFLREELPVSLVLLMDASISVADRMPVAQAATVRFVTMLRPEDDVRVMAFNDRVTVLQESTSDRGALRTAIDAHRRRRRDRALQRALLHAPEPSPGLRAAAASGGASSCSSPTARTPRRWCGRSRCSSSCAAARRPCT